MADSCVSRFPNNIEVAAGTTNQVVPFAPGIVAIVTQFTTSNIYITAIRHFRYANDHKTRAKAAAGIFIEVVAAVLNVGAAIMAGACQFMWTAMVVTIIMVVFVAPPGCVLQLVTTVLCLDS